MDNDFIGRRESVGVGIEATGGTAVAPQTFIGHLKNGFRPKTTKLENTSALGVVERVNDSAVIQNWAEGSIEGKVTDVSIGYLLYNIFGSVTSSDNADTNPVVKDHVFNVVQSSTPKYLTFAVTNPVASRRHALGVVDELEISSDNSEWVKFSANVKAKTGTTSTETVAFVNQNEFTSKNVTMKLATNVAGLTGATAADVANLKLKMMRKSEMYFPLGTQDGNPTKMNTGPVEVEGSLVIRYNSTTFEDNWRNNTAQAMEIKMVNNAATIGASAKPSLTFTLPQTRLWTFEPSDDLDQIMTASIDFRGELSQTDGYMIRALLTNTQAAYTA